MKVRHHLAIILLSTFALVTPGILGGTASATSARAETTWTIMVYMADDYPVTLSWQDDINEMEAAQQAPGTNIIALVDQYGPNNSFLLRVAHDPNFLNDTIVSQQINDSGAVITGGEVNMASPTTLTDFVMFCASTYPADRLVLILWGHGASWRGLCPDATGGSGVELLGLPGLSTALSDASSSIGRSLDMVVVDSCAEASLEMFAQLRGYTTVFVGSEKDVPFQGLPYVLVMNDLAAATSQGPVRFGMKIVNDYVTWSRTNSDYSTTMGVFNITRTDELIADLGALSVQGARYDLLFHETLRACLDSTEQYEEQFRVDFGDFMRRMSVADLPLEVKYAALQCLLGAERLVEHFEKSSNAYATDGILATNATGMTIYTASTDLADVPYADLALASTRWNEFGNLVRNSTLVIANGPGPNVTLSRGALSDPPWPTDTATLSWPETNGMVHAVVFRQTVDGLVYVSEFDSLGTSIHLRIPGVLMVAASADEGSQAVSYALFNFTLEGKIALMVQLEKDGNRITDIRTSYRVEVTTANGKLLQGGYSPSYGTGVYYCPVDIPQEAGIGEVLTIDITDAHSGARIGHGMTFLGSGPTSVEVIIWDPARTPSAGIVPLLFVALPGILVLAFALLVHRQQRKKT